MKRSIGIVWMDIGIVFAALAITHHEDDKTLLDLGEIEIKKQDKSPSNNTMMYYVIAAACIITGGVVVAGKKS